MPMIRTVLLIACLGLLGACASPPYGKPGTSKQEAAADYQDCYSKASLDHYTPGNNTEVDAGTADCMKQRGYSSTMRF